MYLCIRAGCVIVPALLSLHVNNELKSIVTRWGTALNVWRTVYIRVKFVVLMCMIRQYSLVDNSHFEGK